MQCWRIGSKLSSGAGTVSVELQQAPRPGRLGVGFYRSRTLVGSSLRTARMTLLPSRKHE